MQSILELKGLTKLLGSKTLVNDINITLTKGEVFGIVGRSDSGKSTILRLLLNDIRPTAGEIKLFGKDVRNQERRNLYSRIGVFLHANQFYHNLTVHENLEIHRKLMGVPSSERTDEILKKMGLLEDAKRVINDLSLGTKVRVGLARAFLHYPELLILDEPTIGLDLQNIQELRKVIFNLSQYYETTAIIASRTITDMEQICSGIGLLYKGNLIEQLDKNELQKKKESHIVIRVNDIKKAAFILETVFQIENYRITGKGTIKIFETNLKIYEVVQAMVQNCIQIEEVKLENPSLEDYFLEKMEEAKQKYVRHGIY
ncbi:Methionine import ATP-binding protein MetN 2 [Bacillus cereus]|nr:Methionine import ATP-binding protein MetN 2 [Bacillus cereus]